MLGGLVLSQESASVVDDVCRVSGALCAGGGPNIAGYLVFASHAMQLLLSADFMYHYLRSIWRKAGLGGCVAGGWPVRRGRQARRAGRFTRGTPWSGRVVVVASRGVLFSGVAAVCVFVRSQVKLIVPTASYDV